MRRLLQFVGKVVFFCAWPAFWMYYRVGYGRTRVVLVHDGKVLVTKQWISEGKWMLPGGGLHKGEDAEAGAVREVLEETGVKLKASQLSALGSGVGRQRGLRFDYQMFATAVSSSKTQAQWYEVAELAWVRPEELNTTNTVPDALNTIDAVRAKTSLL